MNLGRMGLWTFQLDMQPMSRAREAVAEIERLRELLEQQAALSMERLAPADYTAGKVAALKLQGQ